MSAIEGFYTTWNNARTTYGEGTPQTGEQYDNSPKLSQMATDLEEATPGSRWTGAASEAYDKANKEHREIFTKLANLDQKLAAEVTNSANAVNAGRTNLESLRQWVQAAEASVPPGKNGEQIRMAIAQKGLAQLQEIVKASNTESNAIGGRISQLKGEFEALGNQRFGPKEAPELGGTDDKVESDEDRRQRAEQDVQDALAGDKGAAARVEQVLGGIEPGQALTPEQGSYLSQMQAQQKGMSIEELTTAEQRLGDQKHIVGDSWQLMTNPKVQFPQTELSPEALDNPSTVLEGNKNLLPDSVQQALNRGGLDSIGAKFDPLSAHTDNVREVSAIADIARDGRPELQQGTQLDDAMLDWSRETMHDSPKAGLFGGLGLSDDYDVYADARDDALADVFNTAGRDHASVSAELTSGTGQQFLTELHTHAWAETPDAAQNRQSTHTLLSWIGDEAHSTNPDVADRAGAAAHALAVNLHENREPYLAPPEFMGAVPNVANLNPELIAADAIALEPYQDALVGDLTGTSGFDVIGDPGNGNLQAARDVFAVIDSDPGAAKAFNAAAEQKMLAHQQVFADAVAGGLTGEDTAKGDLKSAGYLLGAINGGAELEANARGLQGAQADQAIYDIKKAGIDYLFEVVPGREFIPGIDLTRDTIETGILGANPEPGAAQPRIPDFGPQEAINNTYFHVASALDIRPGDLPPHFFADGQLMPPDQIAAPDRREYSTALQNFLHTRGFSDVGNDFRGFYTDGAGK